MIYAKVSSLKGFMSDNIKIIGDSLHVMLPDSQHSISFDSNALKSEAQQAISSGHIRSIKYVLAEDAQWNSQTLATIKGCLLYTSPSPRDKRQSRMPSSA